MGEEGREREEGGGREREEQSRREEERVRYNEIETDRERSCSLKTIDKQQKTF